MKMSMFALLITKQMIWDDHKLPGDSEEVPISEWSGWRFDSRCEISSFSWRAGGGGEPAR